MKQSPTLNDDDRALLARLDQALAEDWQALIPIAVAPALTEKLMAIPDSEARILSFTPRWRRGPALAVAASLVLAIGVAAWLGLSPAKPSAPELERARYELALAFHYLQRAQQQSAGKVNSLMQDNMQKVAISPVFDALSPPQTEL